MCNQVLGSTEAVGEKEEEYGNKQSEKAWNLSTILKDNIARKEKNIMSKNAKDR